MSRRAAQLADRIEQGAAALAAFAEGLTDAEWRTACSPSDRRTVGVVVHHVGNMYPVEVELAQALAAGKPIEGVTWAVVADINAKHGQEKAAVTKAEALEFLRTRSKAAADAVRKFTDEDLDRANTVSLYGGPPLTAQFFVEDHALRHSWHHLAKIKAALKK
jgi:DinB family protein